MRQKVHESTDKIQIDPISCKRELFWNRSHVDAPSKSVPGPNGSDPMWIRSRVNRPKPFCMTRYDAREEMLGNKYCEYADCERSEEICTDHAFQIGFHTL